MLRGDVRFSLQVHYAICGVFDLAYNGRGERVSIQTISERQAIPTRYLEQIFQRLRRADIVTSKRGPGGGYGLSRDPARIDLREIVEAVEGPLAVEWFDPAAGAAKAAAAVPGGASRDLKAPFDGDAVVYLHCQESRE